MLLCCPFVLNCLIKLFLRSPFLLTLLSTLSLPAGLRRVSAVSLGGDRLPH